MNSGSSSPYVRWWWLAGPFRDEDIVFQLDWLKQQGFGGVELAWIYPLWLYDCGPEDIPEWLGPEWSRLVGVTKKYADSIGLGCDFTFGSVWPFGGRCVSADDCSQKLDGSLSAPIRASWEEATEGPMPRPLDHLSSKALRNYARALAPAFEPGLRGKPSALFCDSFEIHKRHLWSPDLWEQFQRCTGYSLREVLDRLDSDSDIRYDYQRFIGETMTREFFACFTEVCHELGAVSRVQCHGAPVDLLSAYRLADIPESEELLFNPPFSRIAASAAAFADKKVVSCETFTCIYGFPLPGNPKPHLYWHKENVADLKLLADAVFAHGVNHIVWHGMPFNPPGGQRTFYASVHVGPDCGFVKEIKPFNAYLERVSATMKQGKPISRLAVYLPNEDHMMMGEVPREELVPGQQDHWEMRNATMPVETLGYHPLWISETLLKEAELRDGSLILGPLAIPALYLDVDWLDDAALQELLRLARSGLRMVVKGQPQQPGRIKRDGYDLDVKTLLALSNVVTELEQLGVLPLMEGTELPPFWAREMEDGLTIFVAHPKVAEVRYPMRYGQSAEAGAARRDAFVNYRGHRIPIQMRFAAFESLLLHVGLAGQAFFEDLAYAPPATMPEPPQC